MVVIMITVTVTLIALVGLYALAKTAGDSDRIMEEIREMQLLGREDCSGGDI